MPKPPLARAVELSARAAALRELSTIPTPETVRASRTRYLEALRLLGVPSEAGERMSLRQQSQHVRTLVRRARWASFLQRVRGYVRRPPAVALAVGAFASLALLFGLGARLRDRDLLEGRPFETSSSWARCEPSRSMCGGVLTKIAFHTNEESEPFVRYDLGRTARLRRLEVINRRDSKLGDRAVPLVVQVSLDGKTWREVARRDYWFDVWRVHFPSTETRYLKLLVPRRSLLHLESVRAWE